MTKIILADNQSIFRAGVAKTLALQDDIRIVAQCMDRDRLMQAVRTFRSSVVVFAASLQLDMPELIQSARSAGSRLIVIAENSESLHTYAVPGFDGVVFRDVAGTTLVECIHTVASGRPYLQEKLGRGLAEEADAVGARVRDRLTPKEIKIVALIVQGFKNKEIASHLGTTEQVIKNYLRNVYDKTGVSDRLELALFTIHHRTSGRCCRRCRWTDGFANRPRLISTASPATQPAGEANLPNSASRLESRTPNPALQATRPNPRTSFRPAP